MYIMMYIENMEGAISFEWDEAKRLSNLAKHGVDFESITAAFEDESAFQMTDDRFSYGEDRVIMMARWKDAILTIVYTVRGERIRLISARRANLKERAIYERP